MDDTSASAIDALAAALKQLSDDLLRELQKRCAPAVAGLERDKASGLCFFGVENSQGYEGDATIRDLVKAIEGAALKLPSMKQKMPLKWLRISDELRKLSTSQRHLRLEAVRQIAMSHGLPHEGLELTHRNRHGRRPLSRLGTLLCVGVFMCVRVYWCVGMYWVCAGVYWVLSSHPSEARWTR